MNAKAVWIGVGLIGLGALTALGLWGFETYKDSVAEKASQLSFEIGLLKEKSKEEWKSKAIDFVKNHGGDTSAVMMWLELASELDPAESTELLKSLSLGNPANDLMSALAHMRLGSLFVDQNNCSEASAAFDKIQKSSLPSFEPLKGLAVFYEKFCRSIAAETPEQKEQLRADVRAAIDKLKTETSETAKSQLKLLLRDLTLELDKTGQ